MLTRALLACLLLTAISFSARAADRPVSVMVIGTFHWSNPNRDLHDVHVDNVLAPKRQKEIEALAAGLSRFRPTEIDVEWPRERVAQRYDAYLKSALSPSRDEVVQLGFRLARATGANIHGVDVDGDFPFDKVQAYAQSHGLGEIRSAADAGVVDETRREQRELDTGTIGHTLRVINEPSRVAADNGFYSELFRIGGGNEQPGADLLTAWNRRNFYICANIVQLAKPGDRVLVIFGAGHAFLLRRCLGDISGYRLVEPGGYLPK